MSSPEERWSLLPTYDQLVRAMETLNAGLIVQTPNGKILFANERMREWVGYSSAELDGQETTMLVPEELHAAVLEERQRILAGDRRARISVVRRKDGRTLPAVSTAQVLEEDGVTIALVGVFLDLGDVQTARRIGPTGATGLSGVLERIAGELQTISLFADSSVASEIPHDHPDLAQLSKRERETLAELIAGSRVPAIAKKLSISPHTVRNHLKSMYRKLDVPDQAALVEHVRSLASGGEGPEHSE